MIALSNLHRDLPDPRDYIFRAGTAGLPGSIDLRPDADEVEQQQGTNSCTANAGAEFYVGYGETIFDWTLGKVATA